MNDLFRLTPLKIVLSLLFTYLVDNYIYNYIVLNTNIFFQSSSVGSSLPPCNPNYNGPGGPLCRLNEWKPLTPQVVLLSIAVILLTFIVIYYVICMIIFAWRRREKSKHMAKRKQVRG